MAENRPRPKTYPQAKNPNIVHVLDLVKEKIKELELLLNVDGDKSGRFNGWCSKVAAESYPGIGTKAHAVPVFFHNTQKIDQYTPGTAGKSPETAQPIVETDGASDETFSSGPCMTPSSQETPKSSPRAEVMRRTSASKVAAAGSESPCMNCGNKSRDSKRKFSFEEARDEFGVCTTPESAQRGDRAHRLVGRAFRILNAELERERKKTMFIISQLHYDNLLSWIRPSYAQKIERHYYPCEFKNVFEKPDSYIDIKDIEAQLEGHRGELDLMVLHQEKGIILIQIKSISRHEIYEQESETANSPRKDAKKDPDEKVKGKVTHARDQLDKDTQVFEKVVRKSSHWGKESHSVLKRVIAVPNLSSKDVEELKLRDLVGKDVIFLCKDDMHEEAGDCIKYSESETNIDKFRAWWDRLQNLEGDDELKLDFMKEIIGKYTGPLSAVLEPKPGNLKERLNTFRHCVEHTSLILACKLLTHTQRDILENRTKEQSRVYISGPPGSGKTVLLTLKARTFLEKSEDHHVMLVNMYRGAKGRAIGKHTFTALNKHKNRTHHLEVNVGTKEFLEEVKKELVKIGVRLGQESEGASSKPTEDDPKSLLKNVLFLVDEIYVESFWQEILEAFSGELAKSEVWCAGLFSKNPTGFVEHELDFVLRCPPAVQNLLYHVDWDEERKKKYRRDTEWIEVSTNGPIPLCVRHEHHVQNASTPIAVIDCAQCAEELASILNSEHFVKNITRQEKTVSAPGPSTHSTDASAVTSSTSDLKVVILINMPRNLYNKSNKYIEATEEAYISYMTQVRSSTFIKNLIDQGIKVDVKTELGCKDLEPGGGDDAMATWLYNFQGLEAGVVIFLPGDVSPDQQHPVPAREIPTPGLAIVASSRRPSPAVSESFGLSALAVALGNTDISNNPMSGSSGTREEVHSVTEQIKSVPSTAGIRKQGEDQVQLRPHLRETKAGGGGGRVATVAYSLTQMQWRTQDIQRYSDWDKTNVLVAGSRSLSLLILMVP